MRAAWMAPELPSVSGTFVFREVDALREAGYEIETWSLHRPSAAGLSPDGEAHLTTTRVVYRGALKMLANAAAFALRHPVRTLRVAGMAVRDALRGRFARFAQRLKVVPQTVAGLSLARDLERGGVGHLHVHFAHASATVGMYAAAAAEIPFSLTAHANDIYVEGSLLAEKARRAAAFVTISEANRRWLHDEGGTGPAPVHVVRCGVDPASFGFVARNPSHTAPVLAAVGRLVPKKGFDVLLRALPAVLDRFPRARVAIAGDGPERDRLAALASELGVAEHVRFLGSVDKAGVRDLLARATAFVLPCREDASGDKDGIPVALMEAMAAGVPCVSTRISGVPELVRDHDTGWLADPGDAAGLACALLELLSHPERAEALASRGALAVRGEYDLRRNALRLAETIGIVRG